MLKILRSLVSHNLSNLLVNQWFYNPLRGLENFLERLKENSEKHVCLNVCVCVCGCVKTYVTQGLTHAKQLVYHRVSSLLQLWDLYMGSIIEIWLIIHSPPAALFFLKDGQSSIFYLGLGLLMTPLTFSKFKSLKQKAFPLLKNFQRIQNSVSGFQRQREKTIALIITLQYPKWKCQ